jgi:hypothetical protein
VMQLSQHSFMGYLRTTDAGLPLQYDGPRYTTQHCAICIPALRITWVGGVGGRSALTQGLKQSQTICPLPVWDAL